MDILILPPKLHVKLKKKTSQSQYGTVKLATRKAVPATHGGAPPAEQQKMTWVAVKKPCSREELNTLV